MKLRENKNWVLKRDGFQRWVLNFEGFGGAELEN